MYENYGKYQSVTRLMSAVGRLSASRRVRYGRFDCIRDQKLRKSLLMLLYVHLPFVTFFSSPH